MARRPATPGGRPSKGAPWDRMESRGDGWKAPSPLEVWFLKTIEFPVTAMPQLTIPEEYTAGLAQLITLPDETILELTSALAESSASLDVRDANAVTSLISSKVPSIPTRDLRLVMAALLSLYSVRASSEVPTDEFLEDVIRAMKRSRRPNLSLEDPDIDRRFRKRFKTLLDLNALATASKAVVIQHEHEHTLCTLRIFTDARPVYGADVTCPPSAVAITHMLKLTYHEGNDTKDIYMAFDKEDLENLKTQIARAEFKVAGLHKVFEATKIPVIE